MDPDDNFSPPLGGLTRGKKIHQLINTLEDSDKIASTKRHEDVDWEYEISAFIPLGNIVDLTEEPQAPSILLCNWWHMRGEQDWWKFSYLEMGPDGDPEELDESEEEGLLLETTYQCRWAREENDKVSGKTYFEETAPSGWDVRAFDTQLEAVKPLTRAILDTHIPNNIQNRY